MGYISGVDDLDPGRKVVRPGDTGPELLGLPNFDR